MIYIIGMACMTGTLSAQTVVDYSTFEQKVLDYSQTLKQSVAQRTAMQKAMKAAKTAFFPAVDATGSYQYRINKYEMDLGGMAVPMEHDSYSAEVGVSQPIYAGGSIYHNSFLSPSSIIRSVTLRMDSSSKSSPKSSRFLRILALPLVLPNAYSRLRPNRSGNKSLQ